jgi:hypothetical protein
VSIERTYFCEGPDCGGETPCHVSSATPPPHLPGGFIETREVCNGKEHLHHFCSWDCCMKFAAAEPVPEIIPFDADPPGEPA